MGAESGQRLFNALLVANVRLDAIEPGEVGVYCMYVQTSLGHHAQQTHALQGDRLAIGIGASNQQHLLVSVQVDADRHYVASEQGVSRPN